VTAIDGNSAIKTAKPSPRSGVALPLGAHAKNTGGKKGRSGRPPNDLRAFLAALRCDPDVQKAFREALLDHNSRGFGVALRILAMYDDERPPEKRQIVGPVEIQVKIVREGRRVTSDAVQPLRLAGM